MCSRQNPSVFGGSSPYLRRGEWQVVTIYRRAISDLHYQGRNPFPELDPNGPINTQNQINIDATYGFSRRFSVSLNVPLSVNSFAVNRVPPGGTVRQWVTTRATGIGDISLRGNLWLFRASEASRWNLGVSLGLKAPTGAAGASDTVFGRQIPVDTSVQPGDKAWAPIASLQAFRRFEWLTLFGSANYLFNPRNTTRVPVFFQTLTNPRNTFPNSSADQFLYQFGSSFRTGKRWPTPILAYRISGVPISDIFGASDGFRRPGTIGFIEPGLSYTLAGHIFTFTVPVRTYVNVKDSPTTGRIEDATVPRYAFTISWSKRFRP